MKIFSKALLGTAAAGAMAMGAFVTPAHAQSRDRDNIDAGDVIAGAVIIGGIAALLGAFDGDDDDRYRDRRYDRQGDRRYDDRRYDDRRYDDRRYDDRNNGRQAVEQCVRVAENQAQRAGYRRADVYEISKVDRRRDGWRIRGRIAVDGQRGYRNDRRYDRRDRQRVADQGRFTCEVEYGRVRDIDFQGVRGLR